jgi:hypothetical protein
MTARGQTKVQPESRKPGLKPALSRQIIHPLTGLRCWTAVTQAQKESEGKNHCARPRATRAKLYIEPYHVFLPTAGRCHREGI